MRGFQNHLHVLGLKVFTHPVAAGSPCIGRSIGAIETEAGGSFFIVGLERADGGSLTRPPVDTVVAARDGVVLLARDGHAQTVARLFGGAVSTI